MAVIEYKCTVCKREIEIPENKTGLEVMQRCIITERCRGELYRIGRKQDFLRAAFPDRVSGLTDYTARRALYNHTQSVDARDWFVIHNMGVVPSVQVLINSSAATAITDTDLACALRGDTEAQAQIETTDFTIEVVDANELIIHFESPQSGTAQLIARSTAIAPVIEESTTAPEQFQLTATGSILTVATLNEIIPEPNDITLDITYNSPDGNTTVVHTYDIGTSANTTSPWDDFETILIQGKRYKVRTFDAFIPEMADGTLPNGSSFYFSSLDVQADGSPPPRGINAREVFVLLGLDPYDNVDKVKDQVIDTSKVTADNAELSFFTTNRELIAFESTIDSTYPIIREVS